jgi:hypothetical protein
MSYQFTLEPYHGKKSRYSCPSCHKKNQFSKYVNLTSNTYVNEDVGKCNREAKCGYHYTPSQYFKNNPQSDGKTFTSPKIIIPKRKMKDKISVIPSKYVKLSRNKAHLTPFYNYFSKILSEEALDDAYKLYKVGRYNHKNWTNCVLFWQIDANGKVRTGKIFKYNPSKGKRIAQNWFHSLHYKDQFELKQVPFGLHLIDQSPYKKIAIVESEKTAILMSIAIPNFIWIAVGGCQNLNYSMLSEIKNRDLILFPDAGKYELWLSKIDKLPKSNFYTVSDMLHNHTSSFEKKEDYDIADYYLEELKSARSSGLI